LASDNCKITKKHSCSRDLLLHFSAFGLGRIIINEVISTSNEFTILVSEEQVDVAFKVIKDLKN
jgi:hypothetical protein